MTNHSSNVGRQIAEISVKKQITDPTVALASTAYKF
ncbi:MAG: hypothetical protein ACI9DH_000018 [Halioglobus sp.]|jgi:hypothetical protein